MEIRSDDRPSGTYRDDYIYWKSWGESSFGKVRSVDTAYFAAELRRTKASFPRGSRVLEIGFGNGKFLKFAVGNGWDVVGTEVNAALVSVARDNGFNAVECVDLQGFSSGCFDLVVAFDVLEHLPDDALVEMLSNIRRVLKDDGVFVARFPNGDSPLGLAYQNGDLTHLSAIGSEKMRYLAGRVGMELFRIGGEAQPLLCGSLVHFIHRMIALPIKYSIETFVRLVFFPTLRICFASPNLSVVLRVNGRR